MSDDAVGLWLKQAGRVQLLTGDQEVELGTAVQRWLNSPDPSPQVVAAGQVARRKMIEANLRLVATIAAKRRGQTSVPFEDLLQAGSEGLQRAAEKFDPTKGYKFSTYAYWWIRQGVTRLITDTSPDAAARVPAWVYDARLKLRRSVAAFSQQHQRNPTPTELVELRRAAGITPKQWEYIAPWLVGTASLDSPLASQLDDGAATLVDVIASNGPSPEDALVEAEMRDGVQRLLAGLPDRERLAVSMRYGIGTPACELPAIGRALGCSSERARQILARAMRQLREAVAPAPTPADQQAA